jgi:hypothetical protein
MSAVSALAEDFARRSGTSLTGREMQFAKKTSDERM